MQSRATVVEGDAQAGATQLNDLVAALLERFESEGAAALEALCSAHPEHAAALRRRFALLGEAGVLTTPREHEVPEKLGDFRLLRQLGGGGMGVVYLAVQEPLGREVALKIVRPEHLYFPGTRERFRREVDTIARLQHPGIVPIYAVGDANGVPYFAMERVRGHSLEHALAALRGRDPSTLAGQALAPASSEGDYLFRGTWEQACLRVVRQVAEALEYAHQQGVLHRDIKPSNVMLTSHGGSRAMLLDFGLASASGTTRLTRSGARLGTLHYMSPEQVRSDTDAISARSDVYALGVTLYELLTLQRPFDGATDVEIALAISLGSCKRPRERNPALSQEAEIVCLAALEHDPVLRYPSAADFARDLGNVLDHHPLEARRASTLSRARKWVRRNPTTSVAFALGALVVVGGPALYAWQQQRSEKLLRDQRDRAQVNLEQAVAAVERMTQMGDEQLRFEPHAEQQRAALLQDAVAFLQPLIAVQSNDPRLRIETAQAHERLGSFLAELGRSDEALRAFDGALAVLAADGEELEPDLDHDRSLARVRVARTGLICEGNDLALAREEFVRLRAELDQALKRWPDDVALRAISVGSDSHFATLLRDAGEYDASREAFGRALKAQEELVATTADLDQRRQLAEIANEYAVLLLQGTRDGEHNRDAEFWLRRALELFGEVVAHTSDGQHRYKLATVRNNLAGVLRRAGEFDAARALYAEARVELEALVRDFPDTLWYQSELAVVFNQIGLLEQLAKRDDEAIAGYTSAVEHFEQLSQRLPDNFSVFNRLGTSATSLALALVNARDVVRARTYADIALESQQRAAELSPERMRGSDLALAWRAQHNVLLEIGDLRGAADSAESMAHADPDSWSWRTRAAAALARCLAAERERANATPEQLALREKELSERAVAQLRAALERGMPDPNEIPTVDVLEPLHGTAAFEQLLSEL